MLIDQISALDEKGVLKSLSVTELKNLLIKPEQSNCFFDYTRALIEALNQQQRFGNARAYKSALGALKSFHAQTHLPFEQITYSFLKRFETAHLSKGNSINGLSTYCRTIRAIYNKAIHEGLVSQDLYPFRQYKIKSEPTAKRAISKEKIKRILDLDLQEGTPLFHVRNYFLISYLMNGISFIDLAFLKVANILDNRIRYSRQKTARPYDIKITDQLGSLLQFYTNNKAKTDFIFPIIKRTALKDQYNDVRWARKRYNKNLKEIAHLCNIEEHLTSYVSRHSMATNLILNDVPIHALSQMLGHSKLSTTQIYIKNLPTHIIDTYQDTLSL